jgi:hypothetical protein
MPRVVIELQANTQDAVTKIQQFARAQKDAFEAVRAGNPALADATVKVSALTNAYNAATAAAQNFARQGPPAAASIRTITAAVMDARGAVVAYGTASAAQKASTSQFLDALKSGAEQSSEAMRGFRTVTRDLIGDIPVLGPLLAKLSTQFGAFPLLLGAAVGAGIGLLKFMDDLSAKATKSLDDITALATAIDQDFRLAVLNVQKIRAEAAGSQAGALERGAAGDIARATQASENAITAARKKAESEIPGVLSIEGFFGTISSGGKAAFDEKQAAVVAEKIAAATKAAKGKLATDILQIEEKLKLDLKKLEDDYDKRLKEGQDKRVKDAEEAAEKQKKLIADLLSPQSLKFLEQFGKEFEDLGKQLDLEANVAKAREAITQLEAAIAAGMDKNGLYAKGIVILQEKIDEAIKQGFWPMKKAVEDVAKAEELAVFNAEEWHKRIEEMIPGIEALITKGKALEDAAAGTAGGAALAAAASTTTGTAVGARSFQTAMPALAFSASSGGVGAAVRPEAPSFQHGGIVPGIGPVPIIAHGGETILPAGNPGGGRALVRIEPGAIQIRGTIVDQSRDWDVLVEHLAQTIGARLR